MNRPPEIQKLYDAYADAERHAAALVAKQPELSDFEHDIVNSIYRALLGETP